VPHPEQSEGWDVTVSAIVISTRVVSPEKSAQWTDLLFLSPGTINSPIQQSPDQKGKGAPQCWERQMHQETFATKTTAHAAPRLQ
jgi:hypothetical protein